MTNATRISAPSVNTPTGSPPACPRPWFSKAMPRPTFGTIRRLRHAHAGAFEPKAPPRIWLGAPNSIKGPTEIALRRQSGNHLLLIGLYEETILALLGLSLVALAAQHPREAARFLILDASPRESAQRAFLERLTTAIPHDTALIGPAELGDTFKNLAAELDHRAGSDPAATAIFVVVHQVQRFKACVSRTSSPSRSTAAMPAPASS
jgi:hypothetical protein